MTWARLDDQFPNHPKVVAAGDDGGWMFVAGLCYACQYLTDGLIPAAQVRRLTNARDPDAVAAKLVRVGLWERDGEGYRIHDFLRYNPAAEKVRGERDAARVRMGQRRTSPEIRPNATHINEANPSGSSEEIRPNKRRTKPEIQLPRPPIDLTVDQPLDLPVAPVVENDEDPPTRVPYQPPSLPWPVVSAYQSAFRTQTPPGGSHAKALAAICADGVPEADDLQAVLVSFARAVRQRAVPHPEAYLRTALAERAKEQCNGR